MLPAALITAVGAFIVLGLQVRGYRPFERAIAAMLLLIIGGFLYELLHIGPDAGEALAGLAPSLPRTGSAYLAVGIIGATVMPHVVYLHSALTSRRVGCSTDSDRRKVLRFERWDVVIALGLAGVINLLMLMVAAELFHGSGSTTSAASKTRMPASPPSPEAQPPEYSPWRCWPPVSPRPASVRSPAKSSWQDSSTSGSRSSFAA